MNKICRLLLKLQMKIVALPMVKTRRKYYILQIFVLLIYGHGAYLTESNTNVITECNSKYKRQTLCLEKPATSIKIK